MRGCLREKELVLLHAGEANDAARCHLAGCARCAARYRRLEDDLRAIGAVLESTPAPAVGRARAAWPARRWLPGAAIAVAVMVILNVLFGWEWGRSTRLQSLPAPGGVGIEELAEAVDPMPAADAVAIEEPEVSLDASLARLYGALDGWCPPAEWPAEAECEDGTTNDPVGARFADLDS